MSPASICHAEDCHSVLELPEQEYPCLSALMGYEITRENSVRLDKDIPTLYGDDEDFSRGMKSPFQAAFYSFLVPGIGQQYTESKTKSYIFLSAEAALWLAFGGFTVWKNEKETDFQNWAAEHAGIDPDGKSDEFWQVMTYYETREEYEIYGRAGDPDRESFPDLIGWDWRWDSEESRAHYRQLRNSEKEAKRRATFTLGALLLNRIVSGVDAYRAAKSFNRRRALELSGTRLRLKGTPFGSERKVMVYLEKTF